MGFTWVLKCPGYGGEYLASNACFPNRPDTGVGHVARCTVERLMRRMGIRGVSRCRARHVTAPAPRRACPADLVNRRFAAHDLNELWGADITYVPTGFGWVYVSLVTDVYPRKILGWKVSFSLRTDLALDTLNMAIYQRCREGMDTSGLVHHSDQGVQYRRRALQASTSPAQGGRVGGLQGLLLRQCPS